MDFASKINTKYCPLEYYICYSKASAQKAKQTLCTSALSNPYVVKITVPLQALIAIYGTRYVTFKQ